MQKVFRIDLNGVNCYLGKQNDNFILFDTGGHTVFDKQFDNRYDMLMSQLKTYCCTPENLKLIVLTHGDNDHVANASALRKHFGAKIAMHESDKILVEYPSIDGAMKTFNFQSVLYKFAALFIKGKAQKAITQALNEYEKFTPDILLSDGGNLHEYGFDATVFHLPGHTNGSIAILTSTGDLIAGDLFINTPKPAIIPMGYDFVLLKESVNRVKLMNIQTIFPGHGNPFKLKDLK